MWTLASYFKLSQERIAMFYVHGTKGQEALTNDSTLPFLPLKKQMPKASCPQLRILYNKVDFYCLLKTKTNKNKKRYASKSHISDG